jgi:hypothetical protein
MNKITSQNSQIRQCLLNGGKVTAVEALLWFSCFRLAARIGDLKFDGLKIESKFIKVNGSRIKQYWVDPSNADE